MSKKDVIKISGLLDKMSMSCHLFKKYRGDLTQREFAQRLGCVQSNVCRIERGRVPNVKMLKKLRDYLKQGG